MSAAHKKTSQNRFTWFVCFMAALSGLLFGLDIGVIAGALPFLSDDLHISNHEQEWVVSSMMLAQQSVRWVQAGCLPSWDAKKACWPAPRFLSSAHYGQRFLLMLNRWCAPV